MSDSKDKKGITRRDFIGHVAAGTGAVGIASAGLLGMLPAKAVHASSEASISQGIEPIQPLSPPEKWDKKADLVVVGGGGAGLAAALRATQKGASVILIEKMPETGGATQHATGAMGWGSNAQKRANIPVNKEEIYNWMMKYTNNSANPWMMRALIDKGAETLDWIESLGLEWEVQSWGPPALHVPKGVLNRSWLRAQKEVTDLLLKKASDNGVSFLLKTRTSALVRKDGRIVGVKAEKEGEALFIKAEKAVVLAAGGMSANMEMIKKYLPYAQRCASSFDMPSSTGETIRMGIGAGADLAGFNSFGVFNSGLPYFEEGKGTFYRYLYSGDIQLARNAWLYVNRCCQRFMNEDAPGIDNVTMGVAQMAQSGGRAYVIFDSDYEKNILSLEGIYCERPLTPDLPGMDKWPERICPNDWRIAVKKAVELGLIKINPTIEGLADALGLEPARLKERVAIYNKFCEQGKDPEFGKRKECLLPIKKPPFYGIKVGSQLAGTECGLRVNNEFQVLDKKCRVIPGLYAAFHTAGGSIGENTVANSVLGGCNAAYTSGYVAGEAAALKA